MNKEFIALRGISTYSTIPKFYDLKDYDLGEEFKPGKISVHFDCTVKKEYSSKNISSITLITWFKIFSLHLPNLSVFEFQTPFEFPDEYSTLSKDNCKHLVEKHKEDFIKRISPRIIKFENGEEFLINEETFLDINQLTNSLYNIFS